MNIVASLVNRIPASAKPGSLGKALVCAGAMAALALVATGQSDPHRALAEELTTLFHMEEVMEQSIADMLNLQIEAQPALKPYEADLAAFLQKHMGWATLKDDMITLYAESFTDQELKDMIAFYKTDTGQKAIRLVPELMSQLSQVSTARVQDHLPELFSALRAKGFGAEAE
ncbi:MAG: DUF2059 domain-containing protein [Candidatus Hydrogenedentes bacterium]|nr:DUF2059 domain-containing protein [Candidatus Hydrogenedentota bacterium]